MDSETHRTIAMRECSDVGTIDAAGLAAARALSAGRSIEVVFSPGNGTRYVYLLVPFDGAETYTDGTALESRSSVSEGGVWVADAVGGGELYPVSLLGRTKDTPAPSYIAEKWFKGRESDDCFILERLFEVIAECTRQEVEA